MKPHESRTNTFVRYLVSFTGLTLVLVVFIAVLFGLNVLRRIDAEVIAANRLRLKNLSELVEAAILGPAYRTLLETATSTEISGTDFDDPYSCFLLHKRLKLMVNDQPSLESVNIFLPGKNLLISSSGIRYNMANYLDNAFTESLSGRSEIVENAWFGPREKRVPGEPPAEHEPVWQNMISRILSSPHQRGSLEPRYYSFVDVSQTVFEETIHPLVRNGREVVIVFGSNGKVLASHNLQAVEKELYAALTSEESMDSFDSILHSSFTSGKAISVYSSGQMDWHYALFSPPGTFFSISRNLRDHIILLSLISIIAGVGLSFFLSRRLYSPLARLLENLDHPISMGKVKNEYVLISRTIKELHTSIDNMENELSRSVLDQLLRRGAHDLDDSRLRPLLPLPRSVVLYLRTRNGGLLHDSISHIGSFAESLEHGFLLPVDRRSCVVIENTTDSEHEAYHRIAAGVDALELGLNSPVTVGVGSVIDDYELLPQSYSEARLAERNSYLYPKERIFYYRDIADRRPLRSELDIEDLVQAIKNQDSVGIGVFFDSVSEMIASEQYSHDGIEDAVFAMISHIDIHKLRTPGDPEGLSYRRLYTDFYSKDNIYDGLNWLRSLMVKAHDPHRANDDAQSIIHEIKHHIDTHCADQISLKMLADTFYMSAGYISFLFKKTTEIGIAEYISNVRLEKARHLLENEHLKVNEIAETVGMNNISYFIKKFKEKYRLTPNRYRLRRRHEFFVADSVRANSRL